MSPLPLKRANSLVGASFLSALGRVRETRLTATLAYLISRFPEDFLPLISGNLKEDCYVSIEETEEGDRYDVLVRGKSFPTILEGKTGLRQDPKQLLRYVQNVRKKYKRRPGIVIVDVGSQRSQGLGEHIDEIKPQVRWVHFRTWTAVADVCRRITSHRKPFTQDRVAAAIAEDLLTHLEENQMTTDERPEIYLRDLSDPRSVDLYFRHCIYKCQSQFIKSAQGNLYFAPYFTAAAANTLSNLTLVPVGQGISYISRIKQVQVVPARKLEHFLKDNDISTYKQATKLIQKSGRREYLIMLLGKPQLLFASPVTKNKLARVETSGKFTAGSMGSRSCTLEELLAASRV